MKYAAEDLNETDCKAAENRKRKEKGVYVNILTN